MNLKRMPKRLPIRERFNLMYAPCPISGCWIWLGRERGSNGYGCFVINYRSRPAHRVSYELHRGAIPAGMHVCHTCDVPACVNPAHLFLGTHLDNQADKVAKGRQARGAFLSSRQAASRARGERNGSAKLTQEQVSAIRADTRPQRQIARDFHVSQALIGKIKQGRLWREQ